MESALWDEQAFTIGSDGLGNPFHSVPRDVIGKIFEQLLSAGREETKGESLMALALVCKRFRDVVKTRRDWLSATAETAKARAIRTRIDLKANAWRGQVQVSYLEKMSYGWVYLCLPIMLGDGCHKWPDALCGALSIFIAPVVAPVGIVLFAAAGVESLCAPNNPLQVEIYFRKDEKRTIELQTWPCPACRATWLNFLGRDVVKVTDTQLEELGIVAMPRVVAMDK
jgi:hypothetical protein